MQSASGLKNGEVASGVLAGGIRGLRPDQGGGIVRGAFASRR